MKLKLGNKKSPALGKLLPQFSDYEMKLKASKDCISSQASELSNIFIKTEINNVVHMDPVFKKGHVSQMTKQFDQASSANKSPQKNSFVKGASSVARLIDIFSTITLL